MLSNKRLTNSLFLVTFGSFLILLLVLRTGVLGRLAQANSSHAAYLGAMMPTGDTTSCPKVMARLDGTVQDNPPVTFSGPLQLIHQLRSAWERQDVEQMGALIRLYGEQELPAYLYANCGGDLSLDDQEQLLVLINETATPYSARLVLQRYGAPNRKIGNGPDMSIRFYEHLLDTVPDDQIGNLRLAQLYLKSQPELAAQHAQRAIEGDQPLTRYALFAYGVLVRTQLSEDRCEIARELVRDVDARFVRDSSDERLANEALGILQEWKRRFAGVECGWPNL